MSVKGGEAIKRQCLNVLRNDEDQMSRISIVHRENKKHALGIDHIAATAESPITPKWADIHFRRDELRMVSSKLRNGEEILAFMEMNPNSHFSLNGKGVIG